MTIPPEADARVSDELVERVRDMLAAKGCLPYAARIRDFTDEQVAAGELRIADREAGADNRAFARELIEAVADDLAGRARRECAEELRAALRDHGIGHAQTLRAVSRALDLADSWSAPTPPGGAGEEGGTG